MVTFLIYSNQEVRRVGASWGSVFEETFGGNKAFRTLCDKARDWWRLNSSFQELSDQDSAIGSYSYIIDCNLIVVPLVEHRTFYSCSSIYRASERKY